MPTLAEAAKEYSDDQYRLITDKSTKTQDRKELLKTRLKELYIAEYRLKRANTTIKQLKESEKEKKLKELNEMLASDSDDEEDEFVTVNGIIYLVVEEDVIDLKTGKTVGQMEDGKVVFSKPGTKLHKKRVDELKK